MSAPFITIPYTNRLGSTDVLWVYKDTNWSKIARESDGMVIERGSSDRAQTLINDGKV